jgi:hypothetical protein
MQDEGAQARAPTDATGGKAQLRPQPVVEPEHPQQPQSSLPLPQPCKPQQPRQPLAKSHAPKLQHQRLLEDLEDDVSEEDGVSVMMTPAVLPLPDLGDAKRKRPPEK